MDVRFYPAPPSSVGSCTLSTDSSLASLDYYHCNKVMTQVQPCFTSSSFPSSSSLTFCLGFSKARCWCVHASRLNCVCGSWKALLPFFTFAYCCSGVRFTIAEHARDASLAVYCISIPLLSKLGKLNEVTD